MPSSSELKTTKARLIAEDTEIVTRGLNTPEDKAKHKKYLDDLDLVQIDIDNLEKIEKWERSLPASVPAASTSSSIIVLPDSPEKRKAKVNEAARVFFRGGEGALSAEQRDLLGTSDSTGGALVSQSFDDVFIEASKYYGPIFNMVHRKDAETGDPTKFVVSDSTNQNFTLLAEGSSASGIKQQPTLFSDIVDTDSLVSSFVYSVQEASDSFDLFSFLNRQAGMAVGRMREKLVTLGQDGPGTTLPNSAGGLLANVPTGVTSPSGTLAAGPSYQELVALGGSVDRSYWVNGSYMASPSVETFLRQQVTTTGSPFYPLDPDTGLILISGRPLIPNASMPPIGTPSAPIVTFGTYDAFWNVLNTGIRIKVIGNSDGNPSLAFLTRQMVIWTRVGQSIGLSNSVKALVSSSS
jgi:HK97 family phage major capsid protein